MEKVFHLIVVPGCPMSQSQRISPSWAFRGIDKAGYFGPAGYFGVGWRKLALFVHSIPFSSILTFLWFGNTPQVPIAIHAIAGNGTRRLSNATTTHDHYQMEATNPQKE